MGLTVCEGAGRINHGTEVEKANAGSCTQLTTILLLTMAEEGILLKEGQRLGTAVKLHLPFQGQEIEGPMWNRAWKAADWLMLPSPRCTLYCHYIEA